MMELSKSEPGDIARRNEMANVRELLSSESHDLGMRGTFGGAQRIALTTMEGLANTPSGMASAIKHNIEHPMEMLKVVGSSAGIAAALKAVLPEAGPVGRIAGLAMGAMFLSDTAPGFIQAYKSGLNAQTWQQMHESGQKWGNAAGQLAVNSGLGYLGFKIGAGLTGSVLSSKPMEGFADFKQKLWDAGTDRFKSLLYLDSNAPHSRLTPQFQSASADNLASWQKQDAANSTTFKLAEDLAPTVDGKVQVSTFKTITQDTPPKPSAMDFTYEIQPQKLNYDADGQTAKIWNFAKDRVFQLEWVDPKNPGNSVLGTAFPVETMIDGRDVKALVSAHHNVNRSMGGTYGEFRAKLPDGSSATLKLTRVDPGADISVLDFANPADWNRVQTIPLGWASELRNKSGTNPSSVYVLGFPQDAPGLRLTQGVVRNIDSNSFGASPPNANTGYLDLREPIARISSDMPNYPGLSGGPLLYEAANGQVSVAGVHTAGVIKLADGYSTAVEHVRSMLASAELPGPKPGMAQQVFSRSSEVSGTVGYNSATGEYNFSVSPVYIQVSGALPISRLNSSSLSAKPGAQ